MPFTIDANGNVAGLVPVFDSREDGPDGLQGFNTPEGQFLPWQYDSRSGNVHNYIAERQPGSFFIHPTGKIEELHGAAAGDFATGQQQAMAGNSWLLTTPGWGIGVQTAANRQGPRWPGTKSPGNTPEQRQAAIAAARGQPVPKPAGNPARAPVRPTTRNPSRGGQTVMSPQARQGLYPGPVAQAPVTYQAPGEPAPVEQYNYESTNGAWAVTPPGVEANPMGAQFSSWNAIAPTWDEQSQAMMDYGLV